MKLATALCERADLQRRVNEISNRLRNNAKVQEGELPSEKPADLIKELNGLLSQTEDLVARINLTNSRVESDGKTITEIIAHRDCLSKKLTIMRAFLDEASCKVDRYSRTEIKIESTVDVSKLQKDLDKLSKELRETDEKLQELNWTTELM